MEVEITKVVNKEGKEHYKITSLKGVYNDKEILELEFHDEEIYNNVTKGLNRLGIPYWEGIKFIGIPWRVGIKQKCIQSISAEGNRVFFVRFKGKPSSSLEIEKDGSVWLQEPKLPEQKLSETQMVWTTFKKRTTQQPQQRKEKGIKIEVTKIVNKDGERCYRIESLNEIVLKVDLPSEYLEGTPSFWKVFNDDCVLLRDTKGDVRLYVNRVFTEKSFLEILEDIKKSGERLHTINEKKRETEKDWRGIETFVI